MIACAPARSFCLILYGSRHDVQPPAFLNAGVFQPSRALSDRAMYPMQYIGHVPFTSYVSSVEA